MTTSFLPTRMRYQLATAAERAVEDVKNYTERRVAGCLERDRIFAELVPIALAEIERLETRQRELLALTAKMAMDDGWMVHLADLAARDRAIDAMTSRIAQLLGWLARLTSGDKP
jgi:hypothetical protein